MKSIHWHYSVFGIFLALFVVYSNAHSQSNPFFGIYIAAGVLTTLPQTSEGGGGEYLDEPPPVGPLQQKAFGIAPFGHYQSVTGFDASINAIVTAWASTSINLVSAYQGSLSFSIATSGGSQADAPGDAYDYAEVQWLDTLFVKSPRAGTPVTIKITYVVDGNYEVSPNAEPSSDFQYNFELRDVTCGGCAGGDVSEGAILESSKTVSIRRSYILHTFSNDTLTLNSFIVSNLSSAYSWTASASVNTAMVYIDVVTPHAFVESASGVVYSSSDLIVVPSVTGDPESVAVNDLVSAGFTVGSVTTQASKQVAAGDVISQSPAGGSNVVSGAPINLVVSSGPST